MATMQERLALLISADVDNAVRGLNRLERQSDRSIGKANSNIDEMGHKLTKVGASMLSVGAVGAAGLIRAAGAASDLNEAVNVTEQIFGDASDEMREFAGTAAASMGQSERAALTASSQFAGLLQNMGLTQEETVQWSKDLVQLSSDLGSMFNTNPEDAVLALGAAIRGENEPIRRFNVNMDAAAVNARAVELGLAESVSSVDAYGEAQARLSLIMEQTEAAQGDFARTADGYANSQRTAKANLEDFEAALGQALLPTLEEAIGKGNAMLEWFLALDPATQEAVSQVAVLTTGVLLLGGGLSLAAGAALKMRANLVAMSAVVRGMSVRMAAATGAVGVLALAFFELRRRAAESEARVDSYRESLDDLGDSISGLSQVIRENATDDELLRDAMIAAGVGADELAEKMRLSDEEFAAWIESVKAGMIAAGEFEFRAAVLTQTFEKQRDAYKEAKGGVEEYRDAVNGTFSQAHEDAINRMGNRFAVVARETEEATDELEELKQTFEEFVAEVLGSSDAFISQAELLEGVAAAAERVDEMSFAESRREVDSLTNEFAAAVQEMIAEGATIGEVEAFVDEGSSALNGLALEAGFAADEIARIKGALDLIDGQTANARIDITMPPEFNGVYGGGVATPSNPGPGVPGNIGLPVQMIGTVELDGLSIGTIIADGANAQGGSPLQVRDSGVDN